MTDDDWDFGPPPEPNKWRCDECCAIIDKPWPKDRNKFYAARKVHVCPKCKSEALMPHGF